MATGDPLQLEYRLKTLEDWRRTVESEGIPKALALLEQSRAADRVYLERILNQVLSTQDRHSARLDILEDDMQRRLGGDNRIRNYIVIGVGTALAIGVFMLQVAAFLGAGG